ncbi:OsmC family protein [Metabacillus fastidiosus]|uniref:OsmC family protein n=1 Tax=Metabacillus fastidiosus TaxID=1458 RepID=UPI002E233935|nr:OsmC family protein [Metabacillus fastidiosus]
MEFTMKKEGGYTTDFSYGRIDISGDGENGFKPVDLFIASIAVCSGGMLRKIFDKMRIDITDLHVAAEGERNMEEAGRFEKINIHFRITGKDLNTEKVEKAMALSRKNCSMTQSVIGNIEVAETYEIISE